MGTFLERGAVLTIRVHLKEVHIKLEYEVNVFRPLAFLDLLIARYRVSRHLAGT